MKNKKPLLYSGTVIILLLFTGALRLISREYQLLHCVSIIMVFIIYIGMLAAWNMSIWRRMIHSQIRSYLLYLVGLMTFWIVIRTLKHSLFSYFEPISRLLWYLFYIPFVLIPLFSLFVSLHIGKAEGWRPRRSYYLLFIPAALLILGVVTNDLHFLAFRFQPGMVDWGSQYTYNILYFLVAFWMAGLFLATIIVLFKKSYIPHTKKWLWMPFALMAWTVVYAVLYSIDNSKTGFGFIEATAMYCAVAVGIWESCIQVGLIPSNSKYKAIFDSSPLGAQIVDIEGRVYYCSELAEPISPDLFEKLIKEGYIQLDNETELHSSPIRGGYVIWRENISQLSLLIEELSNTRAEIMEDVELLKGELETKSRLIQVEEQNRLYDLTIQQIMPHLEKIKRLIAAAPEEDEAIQERLLWKISVIGAYIKRRSNLILMVEAQEAITIGEIKRCFTETIESLEAGGINCILYIDIYEDMNFQHALLLYDLFEEIIERVLSYITNVRISISDLLMELEISLEDSSYVNMNPIDKAADYFKLQGYEDMVKGLGGHIQYNYDNDGIKVQLHLQKGGAL